MCGTALSSSSHPTSTYLPSIVPVPTLTVYSGAPVGRQNAWGEDNQLVPGLKYKLEDSGIRVPLFISWPDMLEPARVSHLGDLSDILPTLLDAAGSQMPSGSSTRLDGQSLLVGTSASRLPNLSPRDWVYMQNNDDHSVRSDIWRLDDDGIVFNITNIYPPTPEPVEISSTCETSGVLALFKVPLSFGRKTRSPDTLSIFGCTDVVCENNTLQCVEACAVSSCSKCFSGTLSCAVCSEGAVLQPDKTCYVDPNASTTSSSVVPTTQPSCDVEGCLRCSGEPHICDICQDGWRKKFHGRMCSPPPSCAVSHCERCRWANKNRCHQCTAGYSPSMCVCVC